MKSGLRTSSLNDGEVVDFDEDGAVDNLEYMSEYSDEEGDLPTNGTMKNRLKRRRGKRRRFPKRRRFSRF